MKQILYILFLTIIIQSCGHKPTDTNKALLEVNSLQEKDLYCDANGLLEKLIAIEPENSELYFRLAHSKTHCDPDLTEIMELLDQCLQLNPDHYQALYLKSEALMLNGDFEEVIDIYDELIKQYPDVFFLKVDRTTAYLYSGEFEWAKESVREYYKTGINIADAEKLYKINIYANYFLGYQDTAVWDVAFLNQRGFTKDDYLMGLISSESLTFEDFAVGANVHIKPVSIELLKELFPMNEK